MNLEWADWGPPLVVFGLGLLFGLLAVMRLRTRSDAQAAAEGREQDLVQAHRAALDALKALELDREKLDPNDYSREHEALLQRGAAALRELEAFRTGQDPAAAHSAEAPVGASPSGGAAPAARGMAPEWKGALTALSVVGVLFLIFQFVQADTVPRREGASMTGNQDLGAPPPSASTPWVEARAQLEAKLAQNPDDVELLNDLTQAALSAGDLQASMEYNQRAFDVDPDNVDALVFKSLLAATVGMFDRAIGGLEEALEKDPGHVRALTYKGLILLEMRRYEDAVPVLERAVELQPNLPPLLDALDTARKGATAEVVVSGTAVLDAETADALTGTEIVFVSVRDPAGGPPLAALRLPPGPFPLSFRVTTADALAMGGTARPFPDTLALSVRIDTDGDPTTRDGEPLAEIETVALGTEGLELQLR